MKALPRFAQKLNKIDMTVCELLFALMFLLALAQVLCRFVLNISLSFTDELCRYLMLYIVFLALPLAFDAGRLLRMEAVSDLLLRGRGEAAQLWYERVTCAVIGGFYLLAAISTVQMMQVNHSQLSPALDISMSIPYSAIVLSGLLIIINCLSRLSGTVAEAEMDAEAVAKAEAETEAETETEMEAEAETETEAEMEAEAETETEASLSGGDVR